MAGRRCARRVEGRRTRPRRDVEAGARARTARRLARVGNVEAVALSDELKALSDELKALSDELKPGRLPAQRASAAAFNVAARGA